MLYGMGVGVDRSNTGWPAQPPGASCRLHHPPAFQPSPRQQESLHRQVQGRAVGGGEGGAVAKRMAAGAPPAPSPGTDPRYLIPPPPLVGIRERERDRVACCADLAPASVIRVLRSRACAGSSGWTAEVNGKAEPALAYGWSDVAAEDELSLQLAFLLDPKLSRRSSNGQ